MVHGAMAMVHGVMAMVHGAMALAGTRGCQGMPRDRWLYSPLIINYMQKLENLEISLFE